MFGEASTCSTAPAPTGVVVAGRRAPLGRPDPVRAPGDTDGAGDGVLAVGRTRLARTATPSGSPATPTFEHGVLDPAVPAKVHRDCRQRPLLLEPRHWTAPTTAPTTTVSDVLSSLLPLELRSDDGSEVDIVGDMVGWVFGGAVGGLVLGGWIGRHVWSARFHSGSYFKGVTTVV